MIVKSVEKETTTAKLLVSVSKEDLEPALNKVYTKVRKNISIPGFRKGKVTRAMAERVYGKHVFYEDALDELFPEIYTNCVLKQDDLKPVGRPTVTEMKVEEDDSVTLTISTDLYPEVTLGQYKGIEVEKAVATVEESEVDAEIDRMAQNVARVATADRAAQEGDTAVIDFEGFKEGVPFEGGKGESYELKLGSHTFIPGFEEQVVGMTAGEEKEINVTFPEDYQKDLAGAAVVFKVKLHEVKETIVPALDDEFVKDVSEFDTMDELRADIRKNILNQKEEGINRAFENAAIEKAADAMTAEIPNAMIEEELENELERFDYQLRQQGASLDQYAQMMGGKIDAFKESLRPNAEKAVKTNVMLDAVATAEGIEVSDEELEDEYNKLAESYGMKVEDVKKALAADTLKGDLQLRKAARLIADSAVAVAPKAADAE